MLVTLFAPAAVFADPGASATPSASSASPAVTPSASSGTPAVTASADWTKTPPLKERFEYARFVRSEPSGPESISATRQECDCQPAVAAALAENVLRRVPNVQTGVTDETMCGFPAKRLVLTGHAHPGGNKNNIVVYWFRSGSALYTLTYTFRSEKPAPEAVASLTSLCPM